METKTPKPEEILRVLDKACQEESQHSDMSYEEGVRDALNWITGDTEEPPL